MRRTALANRTLPARSAAANSADIAVTSPNACNTGKMAGQRATRTLRELSKLSHPGVGERPHPTFTRMSEFTSWKSIPVTHREYLNNQSQLCNITPCPWAIDGWGQRATARRVRDLLASLALPQRALRRPDHRLAGHPAAAGA